MDLCDAQAIRTVPSFMSTYSFDRFLPSVRPSSWTRADRLRSGDCYSYTIFHLTCRRRHGLAIGIEVPYVRNHCKTRDCTCVACITLKRPKGALSPCSPAPNGARQPIHNLKKPIGPYWPLKEQSILNHNGPSCSSRRQIFSSRLKN